MNFSIPSDNKKIFIQFLSLINFCITEKISEDKFISSPLTDKELQVLGLYLYYNNEYRALNEHARVDYLNSSEIRKKIKNEVGMSSNNLNNIVFRLKSKHFLKSKEVLIESGKIIENLNLTPDKLKTITFNFICQT